MLKICKFKFLISHSDQLKVESISSEEPDKIECLEKDNVSFDGLHLGYFEITNRENAGRKR
jgi:hypothetical protein